MPQSRQPVDSVVAACFPPPPRGTYRRFSSPPAQCLSRFKYRRLLFFTAGNGSTMYAQAMLDIRCLGILPLNVNK